MKAHTKSTIFGACLENGARAKKGKKGEGKERTLAGEQPLDFEKTRLPANRTDL